MEFRAQQEDHHHHNSDQMRATSATATATATSSLGFNTSTAHTLTKPESRHHQSSGGAERRRSSISNTHNGNSTPTTGLVNIATNTSNNCTIATQTLDQNFQPTPARPRDPEIATATTPSGAKSKTASSSTSSVKYKECLKNHAASVGGSVFDGCGEFMPSGEEGSLEALKCAACQCHRNFHRKEIDGESAPHLLYSPGSRRSSTNVVTTNALMLKPIQLTPPLALPSPTGPHPHPHPHHHHHHHHHNIPYHHKYPIVQPMNVAYGGGGGNESSSEELNNNNAGYGGTSGDNSGPPYHHHHQTTPFGMSPKKRFRTKFTQEQKDQMLEFADRVGWRLQRQDEEEVERFCAEVGVKRQVLKVWMHNNKSTNVNKSSTPKHQLDHVNVMMGNLGNTVISAPPTHHDANIIAQLTTPADHHQLEEGELDT